MSGFGWPEWTMLLLYVFNFGVNVHKHATDRRLTSEAATGLIFVHVAFVAFGAYVLHAGGFW